MHFRLDEGGRTVYTPYSMGRRRQPTQAVSYARASTEEQEISVDVQKERLSGYAKLKGLELIGSISDPGISSGVPLEERPGGRRLMSLLDRGKAQAVIILRLDRAFRNTVECLSTVERWDRRGIALHVIDMGGNALDVSTSTGKLTLTVLAAVAEMERAQLRERTRAAMAHLKAQGRRVSGRIPFGFDLAPDGRRLVKNQRERKAIDAMRDLRANGKSLRKIAEELTASLVSTKTGAPWSPKVVRGILCREEA